MTSPHALILPFPAQGHVIPLMELSYCLIERGFHITFINTQFNHERIFSALPNFVGGGEVAGIRFVTIPDGLRPEEDRNNFGRLIETMMTVIPRSLEELMRDNCSDSTCFIADINMAWTFSIAEKVGLRRAAFWPAAVGVLDTLFSIPKLIQDGVIDENGVPMKKEVIQVSQGMTPMDTTNLPWNIFNDTNTNKILFDYFISNNKATSNINMMICNSFEELEKPIMSKRQNILPVGPLITSMESRIDHNICHFWPENKQCMAWLDNQHPNSVIYVAFGSITIFNDRQFQELALGLELTGRSFLWVVRPDLIDESSNCTYPLGFEERVGDRGRMVGWCPQHKVLKHPSIACFITHCGWNSTIEGVSNGVPFICWPYFGDQLFNQSYITNVWKIGLSVIPDENGIILKEEIGLKVEELVKDRDIIARSQALKKVAKRSGMEGGSSFENLNKLAEFLRAI